MHPVDVFCVKETLMDTENFLLELRESDPALLFLRVLNWCEDVTLVHSLFWFFLFSFPLCVLASFRCLEVELSELYVKGTKRIEANFSSKYLILVEFKSINRICWEAYEVFWGLGKLEMNGIHFMLSGSL